MSLASVYADPAQTTRNATTLAMRAGVTLASAKAFLRDQGSAQVRKRVSPLPPNFHRRVTFQGLTRLT